MSVLGIRAFKVSESRRLERSPRPRARRSKAGCWISLNSELKVTHLPKAVTERRRLVLIFCVSALELRKLYNV
jgi:hypothetical protein